MWGNSKLGYGGFGLINLNCLVFYLLIIVVKQENDWFCVLNYYGKKFMDFECCRLVLIVVFLLEIEFVGVGCGIWLNVVLCGFFRGDYCFGVILLGFYYLSM